MEPPPMTYFEDHEVVPDALDEIPPHLLEVVYEFGIRLLLGNEFKPFDVKNHPRVYYISEKLKYHHTIMILDIDVPSKEKRESEFLHWLVVNLPGPAVQVQQGEPLAQYVGIMPGKGTGLHRYLYLVYRQPDGKMTFDEKFIPKTSIEGRENFDRKKFVEKYNLGKPVAGNFFYAEYDDYVLKTYEELGIKKS